MKEINGKDKQNKKKYKMKKEDWKEKKRMRRVKENKEKQKVGNKNRGNAKDFIQNKMVIKVNHSEMNYKNYH